MVLFIFNLTFLKFIQLHWDLGLPGWLMRVKNPPAKQETQVLSLGQEDPLE